MSVLVFLAGLPLAVWALAAVYGFLDEADAYHALVRLSARLLVVVAVVALIPDAGAPLVWAFATVAVLHVGAFYLGRWLLKRGFVSKLVE